MKKDKTKIPKGFYCYTFKDNKRIPCPYWVRMNDRPEQENGYCTYLEKGDWQINIEAELKDAKTGRTVKRKGEPAPFPIALLWDMCKECGENEYTDKELENMIDEQS